VTTKTAGLLLAKLIADVSGQPASLYVPKAEQIVGEIMDDAIREAKSCATCECIDESKAEDVCRDYCDDAIDEAVKEAIEKHIDLYHKRDERQITLDGLEASA
jgi:hypothetical protein